LNDAAGFGAVTPSYPPFYGAYDVSRRIGVSPWYWWDDVPARHHDALHIRPGRHTQGTPAVRYRSLPARAGGYGLYYHFDYVGGSRNYKWADTANLANTWEQLHTSYASGIDRLWVANVGDLKDNERATQFFLDYAWNPAALPVDGIAAWERQYAAQSFGTTAAPAVADQAAFHQLVLYPVKATANLYALRQAQFLNRRYWTQGRAATNDFATTAEARIADDKAMSDYYNTTLSGGKWRGGTGGPIRPRRPRCRRSARTRRRRPSTSTSSTAAPPREGTTWR
jgi:hypothetical protein